ncbi:hypothetical protein BH09ACT8_BH09ACT8_12760 [soil metagenome]
MNPEDDSATGQSVPHMPCPSCGQDVAAGGFCGLCGAHLSARRGNGPAGLRFGFHCAAPDQHVVCPWITTSVFPRLPRRSRSAFRAGLVALVCLLLLCALLRGQPPLIGVSALGLPLLFLVYLKETDAFKDMSVVTLLVTATLSTAIGVGWALTLNTIWSLTYDDVLGTPMTTSQRLINLVVIPIAGVTLFLIPVVAVRVWRPGVRESLNGFVIGALAALCNTSAGTVTQQATLFSNGLVDKDVPLDALLASAAVRGCATPLTALAAGGLIGAALWFRRRPASTLPRRRHFLTTPIFAVVLVVIAYTGQNAIDYAWISYTEIVALYAAIALFTLLALRILLHCTLLEEAATGVTADQPILCTQCDHVVPDLTFCSNCGAAADAASRSSREARRFDRPVPAAPEGR